jgi:methionyl-tRNA formyltransferase
MEEGIDTGDILASREIPVGLSDTGLTLFMKCLTQGAELVGELIPAFRDQGRLQGRKQDLARRGYYGQDAPYRGVASFAWSPRQVTDFVRALSYRPFQSPTSAPYTFWRGRPLELGAPLRPAEPGSGGAPGEVLEAAEDRLVCAAGAGAVEVGKLDAGQGLEPGGLAARRLGLRPGDRLGR